MKKLPDCSITIEISFLIQKIFIDLAFMQKNSRSASKYIISNFKERDIIVHTCESTAVPCIYYFSISGNKKILQTNKPSLTSKDYVINDKNEIPRFIKDKKGFG